MNRFKHSLSSCLPPASSCKLFLSSSHWYVVVVCNAGSIAPSNSRDQGTHGKPYFLVLDSLGDAHETAVSNLRSFLRLEYQDKRRGAIVFSNEKMAVHTPEVPTQQNSCDCGLFLLHYVELIFEVSCHDLDIMDNDMVKKCSFSCRTQKNFTSPPPRRSCAAGSRQTT